MCWCFSAARGVTVSSNVDWPVKGCWRSPTWLWGRPCLYLPATHKETKEIMCIGWLAWYSATSENNMPPKSAHETAAAEIKRFREEKPLPLLESPLSWWKEQEHANPELSKLAKGFLCIPDTSVFSTAGDILTAHRSTLKSEHADQLIFLQKNLDITK